MPCFSLIQTSAMSKFLVVQLKFYVCETLLIRVGYYETWLTLRIIFMWKSILYKSYVAAYTQYSSLMYILKLSWSLD